MGSFRVPKIARGARHQSIPRTPSLKSQVERSTSTQCLRDCTRGLQPSLRPSIGADPLQNLHIWSNTRPNVHFQSWTESVLVSLSYEQDHFQVGQTTFKNRIFASARSRLYRRIFRFSLHFRVEYAPISPQRLKISAASMKKWWKIFTQMAKNAILTHFFTLEKNFRKKSFW